MSKSCEHIEEMTNREILKNNYYEKIMKMTLNISADELIDILNYVESNNLFEKELYENLYVILEKEKYILINYNVESKIFNRLSEKQKMKLERMFTDRLKDYSEEDAAKTSEHLIKYGYINTLDIDYQKNFFNSCYFSNKREFDMTEDKVYMRRGINYYSDDYGHHETKTLYVNYTDRADVQFNTEKQKKDKTLYFDGIDNAKFDNHDYIFFDTNSKFEYAINYHNGDVIKLKKDAKHCRDYVFGYFISKNDNKLCLFDNESKLIKEFNDVFSYRIDYVKELFIISNGCNKISFYNKEFELLKEIDISLFIKGTYSIHTINDGVITFSLNENDEILYFDYINMKVIDKFKTNNKKLDISQFAYSGGLYNYVENDLIGYKDVNGVVRIRPQFKNVGPFLGNIAQKDYYSECGVIDKAGNFICNKDYVKNLLDNRKKYITKVDPNYWKENGSSAYDDLITYGITLSPDYQEGKYRINLKKIKVGYLTVEDNYIIDVNDPIKEINFAFPKEKTIKKIS